tara:strand:- start:45595 stop:46764 length:1170 start_codon:yes stop_codon:yes gene_type:complete
MVANQLIKLRSLLFVTLVFLTIENVIGQSCPLNTPEFPFTTDYNDYSWSSGLYFSSQLGGAQTMNSISFRLDNDNSWGNYTYNDIRIYLRHTAVENFASDPGYPGTGGFTQVYSGNMTFNGPGVYTFNFNVAASFVYNGSSQLEVLIENRGNTDNTWEEPWFDRTNATAAGIYPGKVGFGGTWGGATSMSTNRQFNLALQFANPGDICNYPLPVTLLSSDIRCEGKYSILTWSTASELNNDFFTISVSENGKSWRKIKKVKGAGNSNEKIDYQESIEVKNSEITYYKLSQTDFDGKTEVLNIFTNDCSIGTVVETYPNPTTDFLNISSSKQLASSNIKIQDSNGRQFNVKFVPNTNYSGQIDISHLSPGVYTLWIRSSEFNEVIKVTKR